MGSCLGRVVSSLDGTDPVVPGDSGGAAAGGRGRSSNIEDQGSFPVEAQVNHGFKEGRRRRTDGGWCWLLLFSLVAWGATIWALHSAPRRVEELAGGAVLADVSRVAVPVDASGDTCVGLTPYRYEPRAANDAALRLWVGRDAAATLYSANVGVCVEECPNAGDVVCSAAGAVAMNGLLQLETTVPGGSLVPAFLSEWLVNGTAWTRSGVFDGCSEAAARVASDSCDMVAAACWLTHADTLPWMKRCVGVHEVHAWEQVECVTDSTTGGSRSGSTAVLQRIEDGVQVFNAAAEYWANCQQAQRTVGGGGSVAHADGSFTAYAYGWGEVLERGLLDLWNAQRVVLVVGGGVATALCFTWGAMLHFAPVRLLHGTAVGAVCLMVVTTMFCFWRAGDIALPWAAHFSPGASSATSESLATASEPWRDSSDGLFAPSAGRWGVYSEGDLLEAQATETRFRYGGYAAAATALMSTVLGTLVSRRVRVAAALLREVTASLSQMPGLVLCPLATAAASAGLQVLWVFLAMMVISLKDTTTPHDLSVKIAAEVASGRLNATAVPMSLLHCVNNATVSHDAFAVHSSSDELVLACDLPSVVYLERRGTGIGLMIFCTWMIVWCHRFMDYLSLTTVAGAICRWYWTLRRSTVPFTTVVAAGLRSLLYHSGSVAYGGFLMALFQFVRPLMSMLDRQVERLRRLSNSRRRLRGCTATALRWLTWTFENCSHLVLDEAFVFVAMKGHSYCEAAVVASRTIVKELDTLESATSAVGKLVVLGRVAVASTSTIVAAAWLNLDKRYGPGGARELTGVTVPLMMTALLGYIISDAFFDVYNMAVQATLLSYVEDRNINTGSAVKPYFHSGGLKRAIDVASANIEKRLLQAPAATEDRKAQPEGVIRPATTPREVLRRFRRKNAKVAAANAGVPMEQAIEREMMRVRETQAALQHLSDATGADNFRANEPQDGPRRGRTTVSATEVI